jgi:hypothetical protein
LSPRRCLLAIAAALVLGGCGPDGADEVADEAANTETTADRTTTTSNPSTTTTWSRPACPDPTLDRTTAVRVADPSLDEISGVAVSAHDPGTVWVIEDSGNPSTVTALSPAGVTLSALSLAATNTDWEDLAILHGEDGGTIFVGDIGDNDEVRPEVTVLRLSEPDPHAPSATVEPESLTLRLPQPANAEALVVDPLTDDIVIVTKALDGTAAVLVATGAASAPDGSVHEMADQGQLDLGLLSAVLAGDVAPDGSSVALRTPSRVVWWPRDPTRSIADTILGSDPCALPSLVDPLGEALALSGRDYVLIGEGSGARLAKAVE